jgi:PIN domain nuclease of toxin-antitoxin system
MARVLLDTTYLLPSAGIGVEGVPADAIRRIKASGNEVVASEISLFEVLAKGAKLASQGKADPDRISLAIKSVLSDGSIGKVDPFSEDAVEMAIELRAHHADFLDCVIIASAASQCDALVTEDAGIPRNDGLMDAVRRRKPEFRTLTLKALLAREP